MTTVTICGEDAEFDGDRFLVTLEVFDRLAKVYEDEHLPPRENVALSYDGVPVEVKGYETT